MEPVYTAIATSVGGRNGHVKTSDGILDLEVRSPQSMGGENNKYTNPEQLFAAGYAACFGSALNHAALLQKKRITSSVTAKVNLLKKEEGGFKLSVELDVHVDDMDKRQAQELAEAAHNICPYSNAVKASIEVTIKVI